MFEILNHFLHSLNLLLALYLYIQVDAKRVWVQMIMFTYHLDPYD